MSDIYGTDISGPGLWGDAPAAASDDVLELRRGERGVSGAVRAQQSVDAAIETGLGAFGARALRRGARWAGEATGLLDAPRLLDVDEANERYGIEGALSFDAPVSEGWAAERYEIKSRELFRADTMSRAREGGIVEDFLAGFYGSLFDPGNLALGFIPALGFGNSLRTALPGVAALEASSNVVARMGGRAVFGAIEGGIANAAIEPAMFGFSVWEGREYGLVDSLTNVLVGAGIGGGIGLIFGKRRPQEVIDDRAGLPPEVRGAPPEARAAATFSAISSIGSNTPIEAATIFDAAAAQRRAALIDHGQAHDLRHVPIKDAEIYTPSGARERAIYALAEIEDLITSNTDALMINPAYPAALQPRDRTRAASETQISQFGAPFQPERWGETFQGEAGAPVVGSDGVVESGNGRTIFLRRAYRANDERAGRYRAWLAAQGYPVEGFRQPVLVRVTDARRDVSARVRFTEELNKPSAAVMSASENAFSDARRFGLETLHLHRGGAIGSAENAGFAREAIGRLTSEAERGALIDANGRLSKQGETRLEAALMARAYGDASLVEMRFEALDDDVKTIGAALADAAPAMARLAAKIDAQEVSAEFDIRPNLQSAVAVLRQARKAGKSVRVFLSELSAQGDMFSAGLDPRTLDALALLVDDGVRVRARAKIAAGLDAFARAGEASPQPVMFDEARIDYGQGLEAAGRAAGEPGLRARDGGGAAGGGRDTNQGGAPEAGALDDARDDIAADLQRQLEARFTSEQAAPMARVYANGIANLAAHYGEDPRALHAARGVRIADDGAASGGGRVLQQFNQAPARTLSKAEAKALKRADAALAKAERQALAYRAAAACAAQNGFAGNGVAEMIAGNLGGVAIGAAGATIAAADSAIDRGRAERQAEAERLAADAAGFEQRKSEAAARAARHRAFAAARAAGDPGLAPETRMAAPDTDQYGLPRQMVPESEREELILLASDISGADAHYLRDVIAHESEWDALNRPWNPQKKKHDSSASGLGQFLDDTWRGLRARFASAEALSDADWMVRREDPRWAAVAAGHFAVDNARALERALGRAPTRGQVYLAHFMGSRDAAKMIRAAATNLPDAAALFPEAAAANRSVFYHRDGRPRSAREVYDLQTARAGAAPFVIGGAQ